MEDTYRQHIKTNIETLIRLTDYEILMGGCVRYELLTAEMRKNVENFEHGELIGEQQLQHEKHKRLFIKLTKRGPDAFQKLKHLLSNLKYDKALIILNETCTGNSEFHSIHHRAVPIVTPPLLTVPTIELPIAKDENVLLEPYNKEIKPTNVHVVKKSEILSSDSKVGIYPMKSRNNRGVFFMVNIIDFTNPLSRRNGAEEDGESLLYLFKNLGFKLFAYDNLTQSNYFKLLRDILSSEDTRKAECFVMALMTHGNMHESTEIVEFHDGSIVKVRDIKDCFNNDQCPNLVNKPKIFLFPYCRGISADRGLTYSKVETDGIRELESRVIPRNIPTLSDLLVCYASMPGYMAHRDPVEGSWYVQKFCKLMALHAHDTDFEVIIKTIQKEVGNLRTRNGELQTCSYINYGFNYKLYFNPGAFEEDKSTEELKH